MSILTQALGRLGQKALAATLPNCCILCGSGSEAVLCRACAGDFPRLPQARCPQCAEATAHGERCGRCLAHPPHFDRALALHPYAFPVDRLVQALKYGHQLALAAWFGEGLAAILGGCDCDLVIPLPLHPERLRQRGFNQSAEIARPLARRLGLAADLAACRRARPTPPQAELELKERAANVRGAFECTADLSGRRILLVDDVMTSGATLDECARTLKLHGAATITVAVAARALRP